MYSSPVLLGLGSGLFMYRSPRFTGKRMTPAGARRCRMRRLVCFDRLGTQMHPIPNTLPCLRPMAFARQITELAHQFPTEMGLYNAGTDLGCWTNKNGEAILDSINSAGVFR